MMNHEKYKQAFGALRAAENISLGETTGESKKIFRPGRKITAVCICAALAIGLGAGAFAYGRQTIRQIRGWGNNFEITSYTNENGENVTEPVLFTDHLTDPVVIKDGTMVFVVNGESIDITEQVSETEAYRYEYQDEDGNTHIWLVGLLSEDISHYGYAEYIKTPDGKWAGGYSARIDIEADGSTAAAWLEKAKSELHIPR